MLIGHRVLHLDTDVVRADHSHDEHSSVAILEASTLGASHTSPARAFDQAPSTLPAPVSTSSQVNDATSRANLAAAGTRQQISEFR